MSKFVAIKSIHLINHVTSNMYNEKNGKTLQYIKMGTLPRGCIAGCLPCPTGNFG
jgi:hypothetical protein